MPAPWFSDPCGGWVEVALFVTLGFFLLNHYPVFGTSGVVSDSGSTAYSVVNDWSVGYLLAAIGLVIAGVVLYAIQASGRRPADDDLPLGLVVLGGGAFVASWTLEVAKDAPEEIYEIVMAIVTALVVLALVVSASTPSALGTSDDEVRDRPGQPTDAEGRTRVSVGEREVLVTREEETLEDPVEGV